MSSPKSKGTAFEHYIKRKIENFGYIARSAGSHGVFDLILVRNSIPYGIQCKKNYISEKEKSCLIETGKKYGIIPILATKQGKFVIFINLFSGKSSRNFEEVIE